MKLNKNMKILIVGLGLMGGSYARALHRRGYSISAITKDQTSIDFALSRGIIDKGTTEIDADIIGEADLIVFALYPHVFVKWLEENQHLFKSGAVITDVTGVKCSVVYKVQEMLRKDVEFIAAHPMAGREVYGVENSDDRIFWGANYIVVPTEKNTEEAIELCCELGEVMGFYDVSVLSPEKHDEMIAFLSQLTHCIAVSLMCASDNPDLVRYTGDSFRDLTRIARINDEMWSELFLENKEALLLEMDRFKSSFDKMYKAVSEGDREGMREMMRLSTVRRGNFDRKL
ncbi:MAG: prephenate dehydrogenase [Clostridia bacterium]|nr:prephenate dehydrogenase [Clostridia bacterium]